MTEDTLFRFLLPEARARGAVIRGTHIIREANDIHGLQGEPARLFGQTLLASIMLLSISKGGVRQVFQLDASDEQAAIQRMQAEARSGMVRGYVQWHEAARSAKEGEGIQAWMGQRILLSTVRDLGVGQPYISTVQHDSAWLADHMLEYLRQSVQIQADIILHDDLAMMIEAMPGCDDEHWFKAVEAMASISSQALSHDEPQDILQAFDKLGCHIVGEDAYAYRCSCTPEILEQALAGINKEELESLADERGDVVLSCQYCRQHAKANIKKDEYHEA